ncbi:MAG TPA: recombinase family protein [Solirubrobacteraceae bacterium]|nr:recombinase family protein [Solirubrobacteraceae bacterium]
MEDECGAGMEGRRHGLRGITGGAGPGATRRRHGQGDTGYLPSWNGMPLPGTAVVGYASCVRTGPAGTMELKEQATAISVECTRRGLVLTEVVAEREIGSRKALSRPALSYALDRIRSGDAHGLVVADLSRITHSATELGTIIEWLTTLNVRLVAAAHGLDTESVDGRFAADMLVEVLRWERDRLSERTRNGLRAARMNGKSSGRRAVTDDPGLSERIAQMRADGMTLQAIADRLNEEGVPTVRGGTKWRHSSVQAAAGYRRRQRPLPVALPLQAPPVGQPSS